MSLIAELLERFLILDAVLEDLLTSSDAEFDGNVEAALHQATCIVLDVPQVSLRPQQNLSDIELLNLIVFLRVGLRQPIVSLQVALEQSIQRCDVRCQIAPSSAGVKLAVSRA